MLIGFLVTSLVLAIYFSMHIYREKLINEMWTTDHPTELNWEEEWDRRFTEALEWAEQKELGIFGRSYTIHKEAERLQRRREAMGGRGITTNTFYVGERTPLDTLTVPEGIWSTYGDGLVYTKIESSEDKERRILCDLETKLKDLDDAMEKILDFEIEEFPAHNPDREVYELRTKSGSVTRHTTTRCDCFDCVVEYYDEEKKKLEREIETCKRELKY